MLMKMCFVILFYSNRPYQDCCKGVMLCGVEVKSEQVSLLWKMASDPVVLTLVSTADVVEKSACAGVYGLTSVWR